MEKFKPKIFLVNDYLIEEVTAYTWYPCTDSNYWYEDDRVTTIVSFEEDQEVKVMTKRQCAWGWNLLVRAGAKMMYILKPNSSNVEELKYDM